MLQKKWPSKLNWQVEKLEDPFWKVLGTKRPGAAQHRAPGQKWQIIPVCSRKGEEDHRRPPELQYYNTVHVMSYREKSQITC